METSFHSGLLMGGGGVPRRMRGALWQVRIWVSSLEVALVVESERNRSLEGKRE